jgi:hypothetical protein
MSKRVHQINKKLQKAKSAGDAHSILTKLKKTNPDLYRKVKNQPGC